MGDWLAPRRKALYFLDGWLPGLSFVVNCREQAISLVDRIWDHCNTTEPQARQMSFWTLGSETIMGWW